MPRTKLVCTIGPATIERIAELVDVGMDTARINFSHATPADRRQTAERVRAAAEAAGRPIAILADLAGPKIRLGEVGGGAVDLEAGDRFVLAGRPDAEGGRHGAGVTYRRLAADLERGDRVLLADGAAELRVSATDGDDVETEVVRGGTIRSRAGVNVPSERLSTPALTDADRADAPTAVEIGAHYVAQSFVRRAADLHELRDLLGRDGPPIVAKIETRPAIDDFDAICDAAGAVMIARGDLGVELPYEEVPILQKQLVRRALDRGVPTIVATQMLESMMASPRPTRAETSDVANAIFDGADAVMLSGETAIGEHPILAAEAAIRICRLVEDRGRAFLPAGGVPGGHTDAGALATAAAAIAATEHDVAAIACYTRTGHTARIIAARRPRVPILAFSPDPAVVGRLALVRGVEPRSCVPPPDAGERLGLMAWLLDEDHTFPRGSAVVLVASTARPGSGPNLLELHRVAG
ncbi:MAG TPA: pyruvate kinase [Candidatus Limnocylindrales bacterium]|nr:pyruvate kinase [Candidatus Limnocylindrales bacterium]